MTLVAVHQPNYAPWAGYFHKIARADHFIFLDDVQFSKGSYTNRVRILAEGAPAWLTVPVSFRFGDPITAVTIAKPDWTAAHLDRLDQCYRRAPAYRAVIDDLRALYADLPNELGRANEVLVTRIAARLGIDAVYGRASELGGAGDGDARLITLVTAIAPDATYLSGRGGANYQDPDKFAAAGIPLRYSDFTPAAYPQVGTAEFQPGLSILDAVFQLGWDGAARLIA